MWFLKNVFIYNWRIIALQQRVGFCHISTWTSQINVVLIYTSIITNDVENLLYVFVVHLYIFFFFNFYFYFILLYNTVLVLPYIDMNPPRCTCIPKRETPSHLPPHNISLGHPHAPAPSMLYPASDIDWRFDSYMIVYMLECHSPKSSHPLPLPLRKRRGMPKDEMVGWHRWLNGPEFEQALGVGDGQGSLGCCIPWGLKESDTTERLNF